MQPRLRSAPPADSWERPRRPQQPSGPRWPWIAFWLVIASIAAGSWYAFAPERDEDSEPSAAHDPSQAVETPDGPADGFVMLHASWGPVDDTVPAPPPEPQNQTEWQQRERAFEEMGRERWKGTEIFVRRESR